MGKRSLIEIWEKGNIELFKDKKISKEMITHTLDQKTHKTLRQFNFNLIFYWVIQLVNLILISMNIVGYKGNPGILWVIGVQLVITLLVMFYGVFIFIKHRDINNYSENLRILIDKQLQFYRTFYEVWLLLIAFTTLILIFNINIMVDNMDGHYYINKPWVFIGANIGVFIFIYATQKIASLWSYKSLKANLFDLKAGVLDKSVEVEKSSKTMKWVWAIIAVILTITFVLGILKALQF